MLFWQFVFVMFILPWAWFPIVLGLWEYNEPKLIRWIINKATGE